jgi:hypothetical protein
VAVVSVGRRLRTAAVVCAVALTGCSGDGSSSPTDEPSAADDPATIAASDAAWQFPDIVEASLIPREDGTYDVEVTVSSPYDTPQRYADGWRVLAPDGAELGTHTLLHDHENEQPFTRRQRGLVVPDGVAEVTVEGRDLEYGYGGGTLVVAVPPS